MPSPAQWERIKADPVLHEARKRQQAEARKRRLERATRGPVDAEKDIRLPIGPFRAWLLELESKRGSRSAVARLLGVPDRRVFDWVHNATIIWLDTADAALCRAGEAHLLAELYPELYDFDEQVAA